MGNKKFSNTDTKKLKKRYKIFLAAEVLLMIALVFLIASELISVIMNGVSSHQASIAVAISLIAIPLFTCIRRTDALKKELDSRTVQS